MSRFRRKLEEGWVSLLLLVLMLLSVVWSVQAAEWTDGLGVLQWVTFVAILVALFLAKTRRIPGLAAHLISLLVGAVWVTLMLSVAFHPPLVPAALGSSAGSLLGRVSIMQQQVVRWIRDLDGVERWLSNFGFLAVLAVVTWLLGYASTWCVFRQHSVWAAVVPAGAGCLLNTYYAPPGVVVYFVFFCLCALLLIVRTHVYEREKTWQKAAVTYNMDVDLTFLRDGMIVSLLAVFLAWTIPSAAKSPRLADFWSGFQEPWNEVQTWWNRLFTSLNYQGQSALVDFGQTMTLGGGTNLSDVLVLEVHAAQPHYWRAVAYDQYTGSAWINTDRIEIPVQDQGDGLGPVAYSMHKVLTQTVRMLESGEDTLFYAGQPLRVSVAARARLSYLPPDEGQSATDVSMISARRSLRRNQGYTMVSIFPIATANQLATAGTAYPDWVTERYLQLPPTLPRRVPLLAREVAEEANTAYGRVVAIQSYLRHIPYDRQIPTPPAGSDAVDWFLFENRRGYCDYYASAMVIMCRALGIPARLAHGYAPGEYDPASDSYRVRQLDAHAWPEVYFPAYGWIEFEPTSSQPVILRPEDAELPLLAALELEPGESLREAEEKYGPDDELSEGGDIEDILLGQGRPWYTRSRYIGLAALVILAGVPLVLWGWWHWTLRGLSAAARAYQQTCRLGALLGVAPQPHQTPVEYGEGLARTLVRGQEDVRRVAALYAEQRFSGSKLGKVREEESLECWKRLRVKMCGQAVKARMKRRRLSTQTWVPASSLRPRAPLE